MTQGGLMKHDALKFAKQLALESVKKGELSQCNDSTLTRYLKRREKESVLMMLIPIVVSIPVVIAESVV